MLKIITFILLLGLIAIVFALCVGAQELPKYDMNGDGYVNVQDINGFGEALSAGYFTVQDINPFLAQVRSARPEMSIYIPHGMIYYVESGLPEQIGLDPEKPYIVCREVQVVGGVDYVVASYRQYYDVNSLCVDTGYDRQEVTIVIVPFQATQPSGQP